MTEAQEVSSAKSTMHLQGCNNHVCLIHIYVHTLTFLSQYIQGPLRVIFDNGAISKLNVITQSVVCLTYQVNTYQLSHLFFSLYLCGFLGNAK